MIREGAKVSFVGDDEQICVGDRGKVVSASGTHSHVLWSTGTRAGSITLEDDQDLVTGPHAEVSLSMEGALVRVAVRDTYDVMGEAGLLNALNEEGHLATFTAYAEQALDAVTAAIRTDASMREVLTHLSDEEQARFVTFTASVLLRDAFGAEEG